MSHGRAVWIVVGALIVSALVGGYLFYTKTGGNALTRVVWHYFLQDIADKKYSWGDFTDRGASEGISGFFAYGDSDRFRLWTLSGLKTFTHVQDISVYQHEDICGALKQLQERGEAGAPVAAEKTITGSSSYWQSLIKPENLVTVLRLEDPHYHNGVDKVWSYSGKYRELNKLEAETCE